MLRPTMGTPETPLERATEEVLEDADLIVAEGPDSLLDDEAFDSRETDALPRVDAARALAVLRPPRPATAPARDATEAALPDATEKVSVESILGVAGALLADADPPKAPAATVPAPQRPALPSSPTPFSVALPVRIETHPLVVAGRVETLPEPAELHAWVPPTLPPRSRPIDPTAQVAAVPLGRYWPLFAAATAVGVALVGLASLGMRGHATLASAVRTEGVALRAEREAPAPSEAAGPPRPAPVATPAPKAVASRAPAAPGHETPAKAAPKRPAPKAAPRVPAAKVRHK